MQNLFSALVSCSLALGMTTVLHYLILSGKHFGFYTNTVSLKNDRFPALDLYIFLQCLFHQMSAGKTDH